MFVLGLLFLSCRPDAPRASTRPRAKTSAEALARTDALVHRPRAIQWATAAEILSGGEESCIDGRSTSPVLGTPGGDVGEIIAALGALEESSGATVALDRIDAMFDAYAGVFGRVYFHTDAHALEHLGAAMRADPRFAGVPLGSAEQVRAFVLAPPGELRDAVSALVVEPENVGCGHLRLVLAGPERYHVRPELARAVVGGAFRLAWRSPRVVDYVALEGDHREAAIVEIHMDRAVHATTRIPMVAPHQGVDQVFVRHPEAASFIRRENALFFLDRASALTGRVPDEADLLRRVDALADHHARETIERLAGDLPVVSFHVRGDEVALDGRPD